MKVISVNLGQVRTVQWKGKGIATAFFKQPSEGPIRVRKLGLDGDVQADLRVHGGPEKAVYAYPSEHYAFWKRELPDVEMPWGSFGENLTTQGILESETHVGDVLRVGSAELVVTKPRTPCFKMNIRFQREDMMQRYQQAERSGFYFSVLREGYVEAGNEMKLLKHDDKAASMIEVFRQRLSGE